MKTDIKQIIQELKHRRVFRVAGVYSGFAFIIFQIVDATFDTLGIPTWLGKYTIVALVLGFPVAVGLGWAFDITDKGVVRAKDKPPEQASRKPFVGNASLGIIAIIAIVLALWGWTKPSEVRSQGYRSIAVLPFDNYMGDESQNYFVDGMTEAIIAELARLEGLRVISRTSVMRYRDTDIRLTEIAKELGVDAIVEGSVLKAGNEVRITAQLIDGLSDEHLWANSFDKKLDQVLSLQRDVASAIAEQIKWTFKPEEEEHFQQEEVVINSEAYDLFLKGWQHRLNESPASIRKAMNYFDAATVLDSTLYQAHAAKIVTHYLFPGDRREAAPKARLSLDMCLRVAPDAPETQFAVAMYNQLFNTNISTAEEAFKRAVEMRPGDAEIRREYGLFLMRLGLYKESLVELEISRAYNPLSHLALRDLAWVKLRLGQGAEAYDFIQQSLAIDPDQMFSKECLGHTLLVLNKPEESYQFFQKLKYGDGSPARGASIAALRSGHWADWVSAVDSLSQSGNRTWFSFLDKVYSGDVDGAMTDFEGWYDSRHPELINLIDNVAWDPVRHRPEFQNALNELGFPAERPESFTDLLARLHGPVPDQ